MRKTSHFLLCGLLLCSVTACSKSSDELTISSPDGTQATTVHLKVFTDTLAQDDALRSETLSGSGGLLFVYEEPQMIAIDREGLAGSGSVLYFDSTGTLVGFEELGRCPDKGLCRPSVSPELAVYAIILPTDFPARHGVKFGWRMDVREAEKMVRAKKQ